MAIGQVFPSLLTVLYIVVDNETIGDIMVSAITTLFIFTTQANVTALTGPRSRRSFFRFSLFD